jgi:hypothetical protein
MLILLLVLQRFGRRQWGWVSELNTENRTISLLPVNTDGTLGGDEVDINFHPEDKVHSSWALLGRATTVVGANRDREASSGSEDDNTAGGTSREDSEDFQRIQGEAGRDSDSFTDDDGIDFDILNSEADEELKKEWHAYYRARDDYRKAHYKIVEMHNLILKVSWPETSRLEEWKIIRHAQILGEDDKFIRDHIPEVKCAQDLGHYSTRHIRGFLGLQPDGCPGTRTLRLIVMNRLRPIYDLDGKHFWKAFWECVACTHFIFCFRSFTYVAPRSSSVVGERDPPW